MKKMPAIQYTIAMAIYGTAGIVSRFLPLSAGLIVFILILGVVHTGIAYIFYLGPMPFMSTQSIAILSYVEPVISILLSFLVLREELSYIAWIGATLMLGATIVSEIKFKRQTIEKQV